MMFRNQPAVPLPFIFCAMLFASTADAGDTAAGGPASFAEFDRDGNGTISKQEFEATRKARQEKRAGEGRMLRHAADAPSFESMDKNGDGKLTHQEYSAGQRLHMQQRQGRQGMKGQRAMPPDPLGKGGQQKMPPDPWD